jgi:hypothetical protein
MSHYLVVATRDLSAAVSSSCTSFYMPFTRFAVVSYEGSADELARRLDRGGAGGPGTRVGAARGPRIGRLAASLVLALLSLGMLT